MSLGNSSSHYRTMSRVAVVFSVLAVGVAVGWALTTVLSPSKDPLSESAFTYVRVTEGTVQSSIDLNTVAAWTLVSAGTNRAAGVVTEIDVRPGAVVKQGTVLYRVDERPVAIARGDVPAYRDIGRGEAGTDVRQLQRMLADSGYFRGDVDGRAGAGTVAAIEAWQKATGVPQTGVVHLADLIFVPTLPTRIALDTDHIARGLMVSGGEPAVDVLPTSPAFTVPVTDAQAGLMPTGTEVDIAAPAGGTWRAVATDQTPDQQTGNVIVHLKAHHGVAICGKQCGQIPVEGGAQLSSTVVIVAPATGLVLPSAALVSTADGKVAVIDATGRRIGVAVSAAAQGMSVVKGVAAGTRVRVPAVDSGAVGP